jgi:AraC-like DNA-binding protein
VVESQRVQQAVTPAQFRLDLSVSPGNADEFELWRFGLSPLVGMEVPDPEARSRFAVTLASYQFADVAISSGCSSAATYERTAQTIARSGLDSISLISYCVDARLDIEGRDVELKAGDVLFFDLTRRWKIRVPDFRSHSIILPRALLAPLVPDLDDLHGLILPRSSPLNAMLASHLQTLFAEAPSFGTQDAYTAARGTAALIAALAGASSKGAGATVRNAPVTSLLALRRTIDANLANPDLGPGFLCRHLGMSRATLYRLFEPLGGVRRYIQQRRLMRAYKAVTDPAHAGDRVGTIAARCGFSSNSVFSRAFREAFAMSPTDLRVARRAGDPVGFAHSKGGDFMTMNRWLLGLETAGR